MQLDVPIVGILRGVGPALFPGLMAASFEAGLEAIEVTMNTEGAEAMIEACRPAVPSGRWLGMGTIRNLAEARRAVSAGAMFLVSPNFDTEVIAYAKAHAIPIVAGALTPTEVYAAREAGADMVKVFPCSPFGPGYIKELLGPFDTIPLMAVGGVSLDNMAEYYTAGACAVGIGGSLFGKEAMRNRDFSGIASSVASYVARYMNWRTGSLE